MLKYLFTLIVILGTFLKAQIRISDLPSATGINNEDILVIVQTGTTKKIPYATIKDNITNEINPSVLAYIYPILHFNNNYQLTTQGIEDEAVTSSKIADGTILPQDISEALMQMIVGGVTPIPDSGKVNTTGDNMYGTYNHWGNFNFYGNVTGYGNTSIDLAASKYFRLPINPPNVNLFGQLYTTSALNRGLFYRNNSNTTDTIPSLNLLRTIYPKIINDTGKVNTTGNNNIYANNLWYGMNRFNNGLKLPSSNTNPLNELGSMWYKPSEDRYYAKYNNQDYYFLSSRELSEIYSFPFYHKNYYMSQNEVTIALTNTEKNIQHLFIRVFPYQGGSYLENILNAKHNQIITILNASSQDNLIIDADEGYILLSGVFYGDEVNDTLVFLESVTLIYDSISTIWRKIGIYENKIPIPIAADSNAVLVNKGDRFVWKNISELILDEALNTSQRIDGFFYDDVPANVNASNFGRGLGRKGYGYRSMRDEYLSGIVVNTSEDGGVRSGNIYVELHKNNIPTGYKILINNTRPQMNTINLPPKSFKLYGYDFVHLVLSSSSDLTPKDTIDLDAVIEVNYISRPIVSDSGYTLTVIPVDSGTIFINPNKPYYSYGEVVTCTSRANNGWKHITWSGASNSMDTVVSIVMTNNKLLRARYVKLNPTPRQYRVIISDPIIKTTDGGKTWIHDPDSLHAKTIRTIFLTAYNSVGGNSLTEDSILIFKESAITNGLTFRKADEVRAEIIIRSTVGVSTAIDIAQQYYPTQLVMPAGTPHYIRQFNSNNILPSIIVTGGTWNINYPNQTAYDIELYAKDPYANYPNKPTTSWSNAYAAGILVGYVDALFTINDFRDYYSVRHFHRYHVSEDGSEIHLKNYSKENGYGYFDETSIGIEENVYWYNNVINNKYFFRNIDPYLMR